MSFLGDTRRKLNSLCRYFSDNTKNFTFQKLLYLKAHCLFEIKLHASREKNLMNKLNQDTYNTMINFGNTLNQSWPEKDGQTIRLLRLPSLLHTFIWSCVWDPCTFVRKKKKDYRNRCTLCHMKALRIFKWNKIIFPMMVTDAPATLTFCGPEETAHSKMMTKLRAL